MKQILLTQGKVAIVDDSDYDELSKYRWFAQKSPKTFYAVECSKKLYMHRVIMNARPSDLVAHKDSDGLNNQRGNLFLCTHSQKQQRQCGPHRGYKYGVIKTPSGRYQAAIYVSRKRLYLGVYLSEAEAILAYNKAAREHFGEFARVKLDIPDSDTRRLKCGDLPYRRVKRQHNHSGYLGVSLQKDIQRYTAKIFVNKKRLYLGSFTNAEDAARAYDEAAQKYLGKFASTNF